jgi:predicted enzyme related to lactoylglutathione lyase
MRIQRLGWVGTRTGAATETVNFFHQVLGLTMEKHDQDFWIGRLPDGAVVEVFGPTSPHNAHFTTGPVVGFVVDDVEVGTAELRAAGAEVFGPFRAEDGGAWVHFRAPDGRLYELTQLP